MSAALKQYWHSGAITGLTEFPDRGHFLIIDSGWRTVVGQCLAGLGKQGLEAHHRTRHRRRAAGEPRANSGQHNGTYARSDQLPDSAASSTQSATCLDRRWSRPGKTVLVVR